MEAIALSILSGALVLGWSVVRAARVLAVKPDQSAAPVKVVSAPAQRRDL
jgi:hypothetical protein